MPQLKPTRGILLNRSHFLSRGIVAFWLFNEGSGKKVFDSSGNNLHGTEQVDSVWQPGKFGSSRYFSGNDYIEMPGAILSTTDATQPYTVIIWVKTLGNGGLITQYEGSAANRFGLRIEANILRYWKVNTIVEDYLNEINDGQWHQVGFVRNSAGTVTLLKDGVLGNSAVDSNVFHDTNLRIGAFSSGAAHLTGNVDHVLILNCVLTAFEIAWLSQNPFRMFEAWNIARFSSVVANGFVEIAGDLAALSFLTDSAALKRARVIAGGVTAQSSLAGAVKVSKKISGAIAATSSLSGVLSLVGEVSRSRGSGFKPIEGAERLRGLRRSAFY